MTATINGHKHLSERIAHTEEKHLPGGWVVLKFGGTSVGKFAENIAGIVKCAPPAD
jgi:aspartate kinase